MRRYSAYINGGSNDSRVKLVLIPRRSNQAKKGASILFISNDNDNINGYLILKRSTFRYRAANSTQIKLFFIPCLHESDENSVPVLGRTNNILSQLSVLRQSTTDNINKGVHDHREQLPAVVPPLLH